MSIEEVYFKDNLFSSGETGIIDKSGKKIGIIDLESFFSSSLTIYSNAKEPLLKGHFKFLSNKWFIENVAEGKEVGYVRSRFSFLEKRYEYEAYGRGIYTITSPAFSREYTITDSNGKPIGQFNKINNFFESAAFKLENHSEQLAWIELIVVIMGVNEIQKRHQRSANAGH